MLRREYGAGCRHNPPGVPAGGARKDAAVGEHKNEVIETD